MRIGFVLILVSIFISEVIGYTFDQPLLGAILFIILQFLIGIYLITFSQKKVELIDIRFLLYFVLLLYCIFYPIVMFLGLLPYKPEIVPTTILFGTSFLGLNIANIVYPITFNRNSNKDIYCIRLNKYSLIIHSILIFFFLLLVLKSGLSLDTKIGELSRGKIFESVSQLWVVLVMLINGSSIYNLYYFKKLHRYEKIIFIIITLFYIYIHFQLGNRRDYLPIFLAAFCVYGIFHHVKINIKVIMIVGTLFFGSFWMTTQRNESVRNIDTNDKIQLAIISNEFVYPMQTLLFTIKDNWGLRYGYTYIIMPFQILLPRAIYENKPQSLGSEFVTRTFFKGSQGFAYTPTTEAFLNFGYIGPFSIFLLIGILINRLLKFTLLKNNWLYYVVFYSLIFDFSRGDFSTFFYQLFVVFTLIFILRVRNFNLHI